MTITVCAWCQTLPRSSALAASELVEEIEPVEKFSGKIKVHLFDKCAIVFTINVPSYTKLNQKSNYNYAVCLLVCFVCLFMQACFFKKKFFWETAKSVINLYCD